MDVTSIVSTLFTAEACAVLLSTTGISGDSILNNVSSIRDKLPDLGQWKKYTHAPWYVSKPSSKKDGEEDKERVDYYQRVKRNVDIIKERRKAERDRVAAMSKEEREEYEFTKQAQENAYRIG
jgi:hypothetical protein